GVYPVRVIWIGERHAHMTCGVVHEVANWVRAILRIRLECSIAVECPGRNQLPSPHQWGTRNVVGVATIRPESSSRACYDSPGIRRAYLMARKVAYWVSTGLVAAMSLFAAFAYLSGNPPAVQGFAHVG